MTMDVVDGTGYRLELDYEAPLLRASVSGGHDTGLAVSREYWLRILDLSLIHISEPTRPY